MSATLVLVDGHDNPGEFELTLRERVERAKDFAATRADDGSLVIELTVYPIEDPIQIPAVTMRAGVVERLVRRLTGRARSSKVRNVPRSRGER